MQLRLETLKLNGSRSVLVFNRHESFPTKKIALVSAHLVSEKWKYAKKTIHLISHHLSAVILPFPLTLLRSFISLFFIFSLFSHRSSLNTVRSFLSLFAIHTFSSFFLLLFFLHQQITYITCTKNKLNISTIK